MRGVLMKFAGGLSRRRLLIKNSGQLPTREISRFSSTSVEVPLHQLIRDIESRLAAAQAALKTDLASTQAASENRLAVAQAALKTDLASTQAASENRLAVAQAALKTELATQQATAQAALKTDMTEYFEKNNYRQAAILLGATAIGAGVGLSSATFLGYALTGKASVGGQA